MQLQSVALGDLQINPNNDRHGELTDEAAAIGWLLENKTDHMKHLAQDIVDQARRMRVH